MLAHEAHLVRIKLESEGIPCQLLNEYTVTMDWFYANAVGGIKLIVPQSKYEEAMMVLSDDHSDEMADFHEQDIIPFSWYDERDDATDKDDVIGVHCPFCHSKETELIQSYKKRSWISFFTLGFVPRPAQNSYLCHICLNEWTDTKAFF